MTGQFNGWNNNGNVFTTSNTAPGYARISINPSQGSEFLFNIAGTWDNWKNSGWWAPGNEWGGSLEINYNEANNMVFNSTTWSSNYKGRLIITTTTSETRNAAKRFWFQSIEADPINISSVSGGTSNVDWNTDVTINITLSGAKSASEQVLIRYSTDGFATSSFAVASGSGTSYSAVIPKQAVGTTVSWYAMTSASSNPGHTNADPLTISFLRNGASNFSYTVTKRSQTITFNSLAAQTFGGANFNLTATASSGLGVTYTSSNTAVATVSGSTVTIVGAGSTTITAAQAGNTQWDAASSVQQVLTVNQASQTITFGALASKTFGDAAFSLDATASSGLAVSYTSSNTAVATVSGSTVTIVGAGTTTITASQAGNTNFSAASSVPQTLTVNKANQAVLTLSPSTAHTFNTSRAYTAGGGSGTGAYTDVLKSGTATRTGALTYTAGSGTGTYVITVTRAADANYNARSDDFTITMAKATQTISGVTSSESKVVGDASYNVGGTASSGLALTYASSNTGVATVNASTGAVTILAAGTTTITVSQAGNDNYSAAANATQTLTVGPGPQATVTGSLGVSTVTLGNTTTVTASGGSGTGAYEFRQSGGTTDAVEFSGSGASRTINTLLVGSAPIEVRRVGDANYNDSDWVAAGTLTIEAPPNPTIVASGSLSAVSTTYGTASASPTSFTVSGSNLEDGISVTPPAGFQVSTSATFANNIGTSGSPLTIAPSSGSVSSTTIYVRLPATTAAGTYSGNITMSSTDATSVNVATVSSTVSAKALTITGVSAQNKVYDGNTTATLTGTAAYSGLVNGDTFTVSGTPSASFANKTVGTGKAVTVTGYTAPNANYSLTQPSLSADITAKALTISSPAVTAKTYDRTTDATITGSLSGVVNGDTVTLVGTGTFATADAGDEIVVTSTSTLSGADAGNYSLTQPTGLTGDINPKAVTVTSAAVTSKVYDGNTTAVITGSLSGVIEGDTVTLVGAGTFASANVANGIAVTSSSTLGGAQGGNYILTQPTSLTGSITAKAVTITGLTAADKTYDGNTSVSVTGTPSYSGLIAGESFSVGGSVTWAFPNATAGTNKTLTRTGNYSAPSDNYSVTQPTLTASINAATLTYTANARVVVYGDPEALVTGSGASSVVTGFVNNETSSVVTGTVSYETTYEQGDTAGTAGRTITPVVSGLSATNYSFAAVSNTVTILGIGAPTSFTATAQGSGQVNLGWTKSEGRNVLVVRRQGSPVNWTPTPGTVYAQGATPVSGVTVLAGSTPYTHQIDGSRAANTTYHYAVYSESYGYYSSAATANATTAAAGSATYGMRDDAGANLPRLTYSSSNSQNDQTIFGYEFDFLSLGTITAFSLKDASIKTFKNGSGDVTGTRFYYKIWKAGTTEPDYTQISVGFTSNEIVNDNPTGNQEWSDFGSAIDLFDLIGDDFGDFLVKIEFQVLGTGTAGVTRSGPFTASFSRAAPPTITPSGTLAALSTTFGTASSATSFTLSALSLTGNVTITPPAGFEVSLTENFASVGSNAAPLEVVVAGGTLNSLPVYVRLAATANVGTYSGNIQLTGGGASAKTIATASSTVTKASQTITIDDPLADLTAGGTLALPATASSGLTISYSSSNPSVATVAGNTITAVGTGLATITATQSGNSNYQAAETVIRNLRVNPAPVSPGSYIIDFEGANETKGSYASGTVTLSGINWDLTEAVVGTLANDKKNGVRSLRMRRSGTSAGSATMLSDKANGVGTISFKYARYGTETGQPILTVQYSTDGGQNWTQAGSTITQFPDTLTDWSATVNTTGNVRIRFITDTTGTNERRLNIDDITITDYAVLPTITTSGTLAALSTTYGTASTATSATINGGSLTGNITATAPSGFEVSNDGITYGPTATFTQADGFAGGTLYVRLSATATAGTKSGDIVLSTDGGNSVNLATAESTVSKATPVISTNPEASDLEVGQVLGDSNLTGGAATFLGQAFTDGAFAFSNPSAEPSLGTASYDVVFVPTDTDNFNNSAAVSVSVLVRPASTVIFSENIGAAAVAGTTTMATHIAADGFQNPTNSITFSGNATIRATSASSGYTGASGGNNVYIPAGSSADSYTIAGIDTRGYTDVHVTFGHRKEDVASSNELAIEVSSNGTDWTQLTYSRASGSGTATWALIQPEGEVPATENLRVRFRQTSASYAFRVDDVKVRGTPLIAQTITFAALSNRTYGDATFQLSASASSGLGVSFTSSDTNVATVDGNTVTIVGAGSTTITAIQAGNGVYAAAASVQRTLTIDPKGLTVTGATATNRTYDGTTAVAITGGTLSGVVGSDDVTLDTSEATGSVANANAGTGKAVTVTGYTISGAKAANYSLAQPTDVTVDIAKATPEITAAPTASAITEGQTLASSNLSGGTATGVGGVSLGGNFAFTSSGTAPAVGTANQSVTFTPTDTTNYNTATTSVSVTVNSASQPLPETAELVDNLDGSFTLKIDGEAVENVSYSYIGRTNGVTGLNTNTFFFLSFSNTNAPVAPGFYRVTATASGAYTGSRTNEYAIAGPLGRPIDLTKVAGVSTVRLNRSTLLGPLQRVTTNGVVTNGPTGLTWTATTAGSSQMPPGYNPISANNTVTNSSSFVTLTPPNVASINDTFTLTVSDGVTPVEFPVTVASTNAPEFDLVIRKLLPIEGDTNNMKAIFLTRPNRTVEMSFRPENAEPNTWLSISATNEPISTATQADLNGQQEHVSREPQKIPTGSSGVLEFKVPANAGTMFFRAKPVIPTNQ